MSILSDLSGQDLLDLIHDGFMDVPAVAGHFDMSEQSLLRIIRRQYVSNIMVNAVKGLVLDLPILGADCRTVRSTYHITQAQMAEVMGISVPGIQDIEYGKVKINKRHLYAIAYADYQLKQGTSEDD